MKLDSMGDVLTTKTAGLFSTIVCLFAASALLSGCASEPLPDPVIPSGRAERDAWVELAAKTNGVDVEGTSIDQVTTVICQDLPHRDDVEDLAGEIAGVRYMEKQEARVLITLAVYAYCPEFKSKLKKQNFERVNGPKIYLD